MWITFCGEENVEKVDKITMLWWDKNDEKAKKYRKSIKIHRFLKGGVLKCGNIILPNFHVSSGS